MEKECRHIFLYKGEGSGAIRECAACGYTEECYNPMPNMPHYVQWRPKAKAGGKP